MNIPTPIQEIVNTLSSLYEVVYVGGCVRDAYLKRPIHDYDCTTNATPEQMKECLKAYHVISTGEKHGTLTIIHQKQQVEITTYRTETIYVNHRKPKEVQFSKNLLEDLVRRDFTMNALVYDPKFGLIDYVGGLNDLNNQIIRAIGNPVKRFEEDALRILRALRFSIQLQFTIEAQTKQGMCECIKYLNDISKERCRDELVKILECSEKDLLKQFDEYGLCDFFQIDSSMNDNLNRCGNDVYLKLAYAYRNQENATKAMSLFHFSKKEIREVLSFYEIAKWISYEKKSFRKLLYTTKGDLNHALRYLKFTQIDDHMLRQIYQDNDYFMKLAIDGTDCLKEKIKPEQIGALLSNCLEFCFDDPSRNTHETLIAYIQAKTKAE